MITTFSLFAGFLGMAWAIGGDFDRAAMAVLFSALMDGLDGKIARLTHTSSEFGVQYDSLADVVAFGAAPAVIMWQWQLTDLGRFGLAAGFIFVACGALRLARFNISTAVVNKKFFIGLPIPAAGCAAISLILFKDFVPTFMVGAMPQITACFMILLGILMVSRVRYFSFKEYAFLRARPFSSMITALLLFSLIVSQPRLLLFSLMIAYIFLGLIYTFFILPRRNRELMRNLSVEPE